MLTPTVSPTPNTATLDNTKKNDVGQKDIFLKLLVAQMQYQDPMKPQDATAMSQQLAQFNMVEQQTNTNKLLQQILDTNGSGSSDAISSGNAAGYLGHTVTMKNNTISFDGTNAESFNVSLEAASGDAIVIIFDENGTAVRTMQGNMSAGDNNLSWDGLDDTGAPLPQGNYTVGVSALDLNGNEIGNKVLQTGTVEAVRFGSTGTELVVGGVVVSLADITELRL